MASDGSWSQRVEQSGAKAALESLRDKLQAADRSDLDPGLISSVERVEQIVALAMEVLGDADPALVPLQPATTMATAAQQLEGAIDQAETTQGQLSTALDSGADNLLVQLSQVLVHSPEPEAASTFESLESARRSIGQRRRHIEDALGELRSQLEEVKEQATTFTSELEQTKNQHGAALTEQLDAARTQVNELDTEISAQKSRLEEALTQHSETFREAQDTRADEFRKLLNEKREEAETKTTQALNDVLGKATAILEQIDERREEVEKVAGAVGAASLGARFKSTADKEEDSANAWRRGAVGAAVVLAVSGLVGLWLTTAGDVDALDTLAVRSLFFTPLLILAAYCARQSGHHRKTARRYRAAQLDLLALDPFLANMDDAEERQTVRAVVALRWFGSDSPLVPSSPAADQLSERVAHRLLERAERKAREAE